MYSGRLNDQAKLRIRVFGLFLVLTVLFNWRTLIGHQFSLLTGYEGANQAYAWYCFLIRSLHFHTSSLWDAFSFSGHPFTGETQNGTFYPANLLLALFPLKSGEVLSPGLYHILYAFTHVLGAFFFFLLIREMGLSVFAGVLAGLAFGCGGIMARCGGWPHLFQSFIWFPVIFLFLLRAVKAPTAARVALNGAACGFGVALSLLAGGLYSAIMQTILIVTAAAFAAYQEVQPHPRIWKPAVRRAALIVAFAGLAAGFGSAIQLLPSMEFSGQTLRSVGSAILPANQKIPYAYVNNGMLPHSFIELFMIPQAFGGNLGSGEAASPYLGVLALLLAVIGAWRNRANQWVRYFTAMTVLTFLYSMTSYSLLHGVLYAIVPRLWLAREATRSMYLADFALAVLCAFGVETVFSGSVEWWRGAAQPLKWLSIACAAALWVDAFVPKQEMSPWLTFSLLLALASAGLLRYAALGHRGVWVKAVFVFCVMFDLYAFDWSAVNILQQAKGTDEMARLMSLRDASRFLRTRPGSFRVQFLSDPIPNYGPVFGVESTWGAAATVLTNYWQTRGRGELWNIRYSIRPSSAADPNPIYTDPAWKIYEEPSPGPRAWIVHRVAVEPSEQRLTDLVNNGSFNPRESALLKAPLAASLSAPANAAADRVDISSYRAEAPVVDAWSDTPSLLVLSEMWYPGWKGTVNGQPAAIERVDGALRGILIPAGHSRVELRYRPLSQMVGAILTFLAVIGFCAAWYVNRRKSPTQVTAS